MAGSDAPAPIKDIVNKVIADLSGGASKGPRLTKEEIEKLWAQAAGRTAGRGSRPSSLRKGRLVVVVDNSSLLYELTLRKREILKALAGALNDRVKEIQFRIGDISSGQ